MRTKFTPQFVFLMLKEMKSLSEQDKFNYQEFTKKYPSFHVFKKILIKKGILNEERVRGRWISPVEPNMVMAKSIVRLYLEHLKNISEEKSIKIDEQFKDIKYIELKTELIKLKESLSKEEKEGQQYRKFYFENENLPKQYEGLAKILSNHQVVEKALKQRLEEAERGINDKIKIVLKQNSMLKEKIKEQNEEIESLQRKYKQLQEEFVNERKDSLNQEAENSELKETIKSREKEIENLVNLIEDSKEPLPEPTYDFPDFSQSNASASEVIVTTPKSSKTYKLFGIPVFSINNK